MPSKAAISDALGRVAHRFGKGPKWIAREEVEWERCKLLMECEDEQLERAVSAFVAGKESYHLDGLLAKLGKKRQSKPAGEGCLICTSGFVELAVWRGDEVSATNPEIVSIRCRCNKGRSGSDTVADLRYNDLKITDVYAAVEVVNGVPQRRALNREETGEAQRKRLRAAGIDWHGSVPAMNALFMPKAPVVVATKATEAPHPMRASSVVAAALDQLQRFES
jgi:hypothetical protein